MQINSKTPHPAGGFVGYIRGAQQAALAAAAFVILTLAVLPPAQAQDPGPSMGDPGCVKFFKRQGDYDHQFTDPTTNPPAFPGANANFYNQHYWRAMEYGDFSSPDPSDYPSALGYKDSIAVYNQKSENSSVITYTNSQGVKYYFPCAVDASIAPLILWDSANAATRHPLFVNYPDSDGYYHEWLANPANAAYQEDWKSGATYPTDGNAGSLQTTADWYINSGFKGLWVDDVVMSLGAGVNTSQQTPSVAYDSNGNQVTNADFVSDLAAFTQQIRSWYPSAEILHNAKYWDGEGTPSQSVVNEIKAADYINLEGEPNDTGLGGGNTYTFSMGQMFDFVDTVHSYGRGVIMDDFAGTDPQRQYALAAYFLISNGADGLGGDNADSSADVNPNNWWSSGCDMKVGTPTGARSYTFTSNTSPTGGYYTRDFSNGDVILADPHGVVNEIPLSTLFPNAPASAIWMDINSNLLYPSSKINLTASQGEVLRKLPSVYGHIIAIHPYADQTEYVTASSVPGQNYTLYGNTKTLTTMGEYKVVLAEFGIGLQCVGNGDYVSNNINSSNYLQAQNAKEAGYWESFYWEDLGSNAFTLCSWQSDVFVTCQLNESDLMQAAPGYTWGAGSWETFVYQIIQ